jgi:hypothetical protein
MTSLTMALAGLEINLPADQLPNPVGCLALSLTHISHDHTIVTREL